MLKRLRMELDYLENKNRFIEEILNDKLNFKNMSKKQIESLLSSMNYKTKHEIEHDLNPQLSKFDPQYDYLLTMNFLSLSDEKSSELKSKMKLK